MDSDNILSILQFLGQAPPSTALSGQMPAAVPVTYQPIPDPSTQIANLPPVAAPPEQPVNVLQSVAPAPPPIPVAQPQAAPTPAEPPRKRRSVIETIGRLADVFAKVGGAEALYESTLNARADRTREIDMDALRKRLIEHQVAAGGMEVDAAARKRLGTALGALAGRENAAELWPSIAEQAGIDPQRTAVIGQILQNSPQAAGIFARSLGADIDNLGKNVYFGAGPDGKTVAYQVGEDGRPHILDFSESGITPSDPTKVVNTGGQTIVLDSRGNPRRVLPNTERPGGAADRASRERIAASRPTAAGKAAPNPAALAASAAPVVRDLRDAVERLNKSGGMTGPGSSTLDTASAVARETVPGYERFTNPEGFSARQDLERLLTVGIPALLPLMGGLQLGGKNIDAAKELETWRKAIASAKDYPSAIRAIEGFENRLKELRAASTPAPANPKSKAADGWSVIGVK